VWRRPEPLGPTQLHDVLARWFDDGRVLSCLGAWENFVYLVEGDGRRWVLRIVEGSRRSLPELCAELDWLAAIDRHAGEDVAVATVRRSGRGRRVEPVAGPDGDSRGGAPAYAVVFGYLPGRPLTREDLRDDGGELWEACGRAVAAIHEAGRRVAAPATSSGRRSWDQDRWVDRGLGGDDPWIAARLARLRGAVAALDGADSDQGLVHGDVHARNMVVGPGGRLAVFDFDDACHHWLAYDLAVALHDTFADLTTAPARRARDRLLAGYRAVRPLDRAWDGRLGLLARWRQALDYVHYRHALAQLSGDDRAEAEQRLACWRADADDEPGGPADGI
jgi:amicoumacin kinase